jgi:hypothetical protein
MKMSLNELRLIEEYLLSVLEQEENCLFKAKLILQPELMEEVYWQDKTYQVIEEYGRKQLKNEVEKIHQMLFNSIEHQSFKSMVMRLFRK